MKLATLRTERGPRPAVLREHSSGSLAAGYVDLRDADSELPMSLRGLLAEWDQVRDRVQRALETARQVIPIDQAAFHAPVPDPEKIVCLGLNYREHAIESHMPIPEEPVFFSKFNPALAGHGEPVRLPRVCEQPDYEAELVVVIGKPGYRIPREQAFAHVAGYAVGNDVSARDWQFRNAGKQWLAGKTFPTFAPVGPHLVTADEVPDPHALRIALRLNGQTVQDSTTAELIFRIDETIHRLSTIVPLASGDLIFTGTPSGVGASRKPPLWIKPGDVMEVEIERLGVLRNDCVDGG